MIDSDLIVVSMDVKTSSEVIQNLGNLMCKKNYVKATYVDAVLNREKTLPTGLQVDNFCVAIPHTDPQYVNKSAIAIATLKNPVKFSEMINPDNELNVQLVFLLAVKDPKKQVDLLKSLMNVFQNKELLIKLKMIKSKEEIANLLKTVAI